MNHVVWNPGRTNRQLSNLVSIVGEALEDMIRRDPIGLKLIAPARVNADLPASRGARVLGEPTEVEVRPLALTKPNLERANAIARNRAMA